MRQNDKNITTPFTWAFLAFFLFFGGASVAQDRRITLYASEILIETGILKHIIPRFSLKHSIRVGISQDKGEADVILDKLKTQIPVFQSASAMWFLSLQKRDKNEFAEVFKDWMISEVGKNTIKSFKSENGLTFSTEFDADVMETKSTVVIDTKLGHQLAMQNCGRCHAVDETNRMKTIGSTPSFAALRTFKDWEIRFEAFFTLNPHPSFTQIEEVTEPFSKGSPPPIAPIYLTLDEVDEIIKFTRQIKPADLGKNIQSN